MKTATPMIITRYSEEVKRAVVYAIEELGMKASEVCREYQVKNVWTVRYWGRKYGSKNRPTKVVRVVM